MTFARALTSLATCACGVRGGPPRARLPDSQVRSAGLPASGLRGGLIRMPEQQGSVPPRQRCSSSSRSQSQSVGRSVGQQGGSGRASPPPAAAAAIPPAPPAPIREWRGVRIPTPRKKEIHSTMGGRITSSRGAMLDASAPATLNRREEGRREGGGGGENERWCDGG